MLSNTRPTLDPRQDVPRPPRIMAEIDQRLDHSCQRLTCSLARLNEIADRIIGPESTGVAGGLGEKTLEPNCQVARIHQQSHELTRLLDALSVVVDRLDQL